MELANPIMLAVYVIAMIAICWHFAYGIWLFAAKWGITPGPVARKRFAYACAALGFVLVSWAWPASGRSSVLNSRTHLKMYPFRL